MKGISLFGLFMLVTLYGHKSVLSQDPTYGERGSDLGIRVFKEVVKTSPSKNVVLSPHGVASILGMLLPGAKGETRKQLVKALRYKTRPFKMLKKLHNALTAKSNEDSVLVANGLFSQKGFSMEKKFVAINKATFQCENRTLDFTNPEAAADEINLWSKDKTKGHIPVLVKPDMLDPALTRLVALNAIYFKGQWKSSFKPENTKMKPFTAGDGNVYEVPMMYQLSVFKVATVAAPKGGKCNFVELPYKGNVSMLIAMPFDKDEPLSKILPHIKTAALHKLSKQMHLKKIHLLVPKFTADAEVDLQDPLSTLGVTDIFKASANFSSLSAEPVFVSNALQKSKIIVNEEGTEATAATTAILMARSSPPWFTVDRPFLFLIRHNPTGTILFMGQINKP